MNKTELVLFFRVGCVTSLTKVGRDAIPACQPTASARAGGRFGFSTAAARDCGSRSGSGSRCGLVGRRHFVGFLKGEGNTNIITK